MRSETLSKDIEQFDSIFRKEGDDRIAGNLELISGRVLNTTDPQPDQFELEDIVWGLSHAPRFGGHLLKPYNVLEHTLICYEIALQDYPLAYDLHRGILLHESFEGVGGMDIPSPIKRQIPGYKELENRFLKVVFEKYKVPDTVLEKIKYYDNLVFRLEFLHFKNKKCCDYIKCLNPKETRELFWEKTDHLWKWDKQTL